MNIKDIQKEEFPLGPLMTYITLDISYNGVKKVRIRKLHKDIESEELKKSKYKIYDDETYIYDNQIDLNMFRKFDLKPNNHNSEEFLFIDNEGCLTRKKIVVKFGIDIYVSMKNNDEKLKDNLSNILHQICKKYLKTSVLYIGRDSIICRIDHCIYSEEGIKKFLEDFVMKIGKTLLE